MKRTNTMYWSATILFAIVMLWSSLPDLILVPEAKIFMNHLGYPDYFVRLIGFMKVLGIIAVVVPGFPTLKEWAYAGIFFDLSGAVYSMVIIDGWKPGLTFMILPIGLGTISYIYLHKKLKMKQATV